jgi:hypothetical protein
MSSAEPRRRRGTTSQTRDRSDYRRAAVDGEGPRRGRTNVLDGKEGRTGRPGGTMGIKVGDNSLEACGADHSSRERVVSLLN